MLFLPSLHFPCFHNDQSPPPRNISLQKNFRDSLKKPLAALPLVVLLASCGGGSGGSGGGGSGGSDPLPPSGPAAARISQARPRPGSVTQSSNTENGITTDKIQIVPHQNGNFSLMNNNKLIGEHNSGGFKYYPYAQFDDSSENRRRYFNSYYTLLDVIGDSNIKIGEIALKRGYRGRTENSYLALGWWAERRSGSSLSIEGLFEGDFGIFVDGSDKYTGPISAQIGTAYYNGVIEIELFSTNSNFYREFENIFDESTESHNTEAGARQLIDLYNKYNDGLGFGGIMHGKISLVADFDDSNSLGHIEGVINDIETSLVSNRITRKDTSSILLICVIWERIKNH